MNLATIRTDLKTRLATNTGLTVYDTVPAKPVVPCAVIQPKMISPVHATFERGSGDVHVTILMLVQCADWPTAQNALDAYVSVGTTGSIVDALELNAGSGGTEDVTVDTIDGYGTVQVGENLYGTVSFNAIVRMSS